MSENHKPYSEKGTIRTPSSKKGDTSMFWKKAKKEETTEPALSFWENASLLALYNEQLKSDALTDEERATIESLANDTKRDALRLMKKGAVKVVKVGLVVVVVVVIGSIAYSYVVQSDYDLADPETEEGPVSSEETQTE